ncbi:MAG: SH3 domain-containing protein [Desulfuromonadaceae bacterium]|nr:SH3 domain-containing protein [Desulfuromonadaceae bacterium]MDD2855075.1 SH3 domain-containing protein [Desulfuromonadaceae bacterium]
MKLTRYVILVLALTLVCTVASAEEKRWVSSEGTTLKSDASASADNVAELAIGSEVSVLESGGRWLKVKTVAGQEGWVYAGRVSDTQPAVEVEGGDGGIFGDTMKSSQINTAKADSARSIRGLSPGAAQYAKDRGTPEMYKKSLDKVLARKVTEKELRMFLKEGRIGEYAVLLGGGK